MDKYLKEKMDLIKIRFTTKEGWFHVFIGSFVYGFIIINYTELIKLTLEGFLSFIPSLFIRKYFVFVIFGLLLTPISIGITYILAEVYKILEKMRQGKL